jgi:predicted transposase YbfD/YdcC
MLVADPLERRLSRDPEITGLLPPKHLEGMEPALLPGVGELLDRLDVLAGRRLLFVDEDILGCFVRAIESDFQGVQHDRYEAEEYGHGRHEKRCYEVIYEPEGIRDEKEWAGLCVIGHCDSERTEGGQTSCEDRYFIGSKRAGAQYYGRALRGHWRVENCLHWQLDVTFREDDSRIRERNAAQNFALLRRVALGLLRNHPGKGSVATKRFSAALDEKFLEDVIQDVIPGKL